MAKHDFILHQKGFYSSYWDTGLYGNYYLCDPKRALDVIKLSTEAYNRKTCLTLVYTDKVTDEELERAKRKVYV